MKAYFLSCLGADSRAFKYLSFPNYIEPVFIEWLIPDKNESIRDYAKRISRNINVSEPFVLIGLSFGGILANEAAAFVTPQKLILISSVACRNELPFYYRLAGLFKLNHLLPSKAMNTANSFTYWLFGIKENNDKQLLKDILSDTNLKFSKWAVDQIVHWKRNIIPPNIFRIHGDKDRVLPLSFHPNYIIKGGGHFMIVNRAAEITGIIAQEVC